MRGMPQAGQDALPGCSGMIDGVEDKVFYCDKTCQQAD